MNEDLQMQIAIYNAAVRLMATGRYEMASASITAMRLWDRLAKEMSLERDSGVRTGKS